jgi:hypothetical protein
MSIADTLPDGVVLIAAEADGATCSGSMPRITCTWTSVPTGTTVTVSFVVQVVVAGELVNGMQLTPDDSGNTVITAGPVPGKLEAGEQAAPIVFTARTITLAGK